MALTISQQPQAYTPAYNDQFITILSDNVLNAGFYYKVDITINAVVTTFKIQPRPDGYMVFNSKEVTKNYIDRAYFNPTVTAPQLATGKSADVSILITEVYDGSDGSINDTVVFIVYDTCFNNKDFRTFDATNRQIFLYEDITTEYLTPDNRVTLDTDIWYHLNTDNFTEITVNHNAQSFTKTLDNTTQFNCVNVGVQSWIAEGLTVNDNLPIYLTLADVINNTETTFSYTITDICTRFTDYIVYYLKRDGNIGFMHFEMLSSNESNKANNSVKLSPNKLVAGVYGSNIFDREVYTVSTEITNNITLNTNWITESQSTQLDELWSSPLIWLKDLDGNYNPITITDNNYKYKTLQNDTLFNYTINAKFDNVETRQRGI